jgi:hypothetical protein
MKNAVLGIVGAAVVSLGAQPLLAAGHGPVFGATTPTLGRGGWSIDQAFTLRVGDDGERQPMLKTMVSFGITENLQVSGSVPLAMGEGRLANSRMMSLMSSDREFEGLVGYRFQRRPIGIGGRQESTVYVGVTAPLETTRVGVGVGPSLQVGAATGYASRAQYVWVGGGVQHFADRAGDRIGESRLATIVYGYRPPPLRTESDKPDLRFFVEATAEDRSPDRVGAVAAARGARTVFIGPTSLLLYKAVGIEGGILFPAYQQVDEGRIREGIRLAVNVAYFFWLK